MQIQDMQIRGHRIRQTNTDLPHESRPAETPNQLLDHLVGDCLQLRAGTCTAYGVFQTGSQKGHFFVHDDFADYIANTAC